MGIHRVMQLVREVPNLPLTRTFFREFGLEETAPGRFSTVVGGEQLVLRAGDRARVAEITIGADGETDLEAIAGRLAGLGVESIRTAVGLEAIEPVSGVLSGSPSPSGCRRSHPRAHRLRPTARSSSSGSPSVRCAWVMWPSESLT